MNLLFITYIKFQHLCNYWKIYAQTWLLATFWFCMFFNQIFWNIVFCVFNIFSRIFFSFIKKVPKSNFEQFLLNFSIILRFVDSANIFEYILYIFFSICINYLLKLKFVQLNFSKLSKPKQPYYSKCYLKQN